MSQNNDISPDELRRHLDALKLPYLRDHAEELAKQAAAGKWTHTQFLARLLEGEAAQRHDNARERDFVGQEHDASVSDFVLPLALGLEFLRLVFRQGAGLKGPLVLGQIVRERRKLLLLGGGLLALEGGEARISGAALLLGQIGRASCRERVCELV